jgi:hypothetical protein
VAGHGGSFSRGWFESLDASVCAPVPPGDDLAGHGRAARQGSLRG